MQSEYKNVVFSKHALQRIHKRHISQDAIVRTLKSPAEKETEHNGNVKFIKAIEEREIHVIANWLEDENRWIVVSAWVRGEEDPRPLWQWVYILPYRLIRWALRRIR
jgi:hypothetical protein